MSDKGWEGAHAFVVNQVQFDTVTYFADDGLETCLMVAVRGPYGILDAEGALPVTGQEPTEVGVIAFAGPASAFLDALIGFLERNPDLV